MIRGTVCFVLNPPFILLGLKKKGFGAGKYSGFGGKIEPGESPAMTSVRELYEEAGLSTTISHHHKIAEITFSFPARPEWSMGVHVFLVDRWTGTPSHSDEMAPAWFARDNLPFDQMWDDARYWLPQVLDGNTIRAHFIFNLDNETVHDHAIQPLG